MESSSKFKAGDVVAFKSDPRLPMTVDFLQLADDGGFVYDLVHWARSANGKPLKPDKILGVSEESLVLADVSTL